MSTPALSSGGSIPGPRKIVALLAMALLAGCGGRVEDTPPEEPVEVQSPPDATAPVPALDACALVTKEEAEAVLGKPVGEPIREEMAPVFSCTYTTAGNVESVRVIVSVFSDEKQAADAHQVKVDMNQYEVVTGIGDQAYKSLTSDITVRKGKYELDVDVTLPVEKDVQFQKASELAQKALARIS